MHHACRIPARSHQHRGHKAKQKNRQKLSGLGAVKQNSFGCAPTAEPTMCLFVGTVGIWQKGALSGKSPNSAGHGSWPGHKGTVFLQSTEVWGWERSTEAVRAERGDGEMHSCLA